MKFRNVEFEIRKYEPTGGYNANLSFWFGEDDLVVATASTRNARKGAVNAINKLAEQLGIEERAE